MGQPRPELDQAWHDLLTGTLIRYTREELLQAGNATSVKHKNGGYVGGFGISHSLHCLVRIIHIGYLLSVGNAVSTPYSECIALALGFLG